MQMHNRCTFSIPYVSMIRRGRPATDRYGPRISPHAAFASGGDRCTGAYPYPLAACHSASTTPDERQQRNASATTRMRYLASPARPTTRCNAAAASATPSSVNPTDVCLFLGSSINPFARSRSSAAHSNPFHARLRPRLMQRQVEQRAHGAGTPSSQDACTVCYAGETR